MIYTCYEMIRDCRAGRAEGWRYFVATYVPVIRKLLARYQPDATGVDAVERVLATAHQPESPLFQSLEPAAESQFVAELRQMIVGGIEPRISATTIDLETVKAALEPLTLVEKQVLWLETMHYTAAETGVLLRMAPATAEKIQRKGADLIRGNVDSWNRNILPESGLALGREATPVAGEDCLPQNDFLQLLAGRTTWAGRDQLERHVTGCWHCIDHFCRLVEVVEVLRGNQPLSDAEAAPYWQKLGVAPAPPPAWKRLFSGR